MKKSIINIASFLITTIGFAQQIGDGLAPAISDFSIPRTSGMYCGVNALGMAPDDTYSGWQHLLVNRHANSNNNHQLQIASSFATNDRLFFRKIAREDLASK